MWGGPWLGWMVTVTEDIDKKGLGRVRAGWGGSVKDKPYLLKLYEVKSYNTDFTSLLQMHTHYFYFHSEKLTYASTDANIEAQVPILKGPLYEETIYHHITCF